MSCDHTRKYFTTEVDIDWDTGEEVSQLVPVKEKTYEDIDTHRYKCTQCGEVMYYSGRARDFYEKGIENETYKLTLVDVLSGKY